MKFLLYTFVILLSFKSLNMAQYCSGEEIYFFKYVDGFPFGHISNTTNPEDVQVIKWNNNKLNNDPIFLSSFDTTEDMPANLIGSESTIVSLFSQMITEWNNNYSLQLAINNNQDNVFVGFFNDQNYFYDQTTGGYANGRTDLPVILNSTSEQYEFYELVDENDCLVEYNDAVVFFNSYSGSGITWTTSTTPVGNDQMLGSVILHELGHVLSMGHIYNNFVDAIMRANYNPASVTPSLKDCDKSNAAYHYNQLYENNGNPYLYNEGLVEFIPRPNVYPKNTEIYMVLKSDHSTTDNIYYNFTSTTDRNSTNFEPPDVTADNAQYPASDVYAIYRTLNESGYWYYFKAAKWNGSNFEGQTAGIYYCNVTTGVEDGIYFEPLLSSYQTNAYYFPVDSYYREFIDEYPYGDYIVNWDNFKCYANNGYEDILISDYPNFYIPALPTGFNWQRDLNGNVIATMTVGGTDNKGYHHVAEREIKISNVPIDFVTSGTIPVNTTWCGNVTITGNIIVPKGKQLTVLLNSHITFLNGSSLIVEGDLVFESHNFKMSVLDFQSPNSTLQNGIKINPGGTANINNAVIKNAYNGVYVNEAELNIENSEISDCYYGIYISSSEPTINNNTIYNNNYGIRISNSYTPQWTVININDNNIINNSSYGLYAYNSSPNLYNNSINNNARGVALLFNSNPIFDHNSISSNTYYGLLCYGSSSPSLHYSSSYNYGGYNTILANGDKGIIITVSSAPNFGAPITSLGGYNSIYNNTNYDAANYTSNYIFACNNWWGSQSGPNTNKLYGTIRFVPYLYTDPQPQSSITNQNTVISSKASRSILNFKIPSKLLEALFDQMQGHFEKSANSFRRYFSSNRSSPFNKFAAVNFTKSLFSYLAPQDSYDIIEKLLKRSSFSEIKYELLSAQVSALIHKGNYTSALAKTQSAYDGLELNSEPFFANKFNEAIINVYGLNNIERGTQLLNEIVNESDKTSINNLLAQEELQNISLSGVLPKSNNGNTKKLNSLNSPISYQLFQNYPNPFNPTTTINYTIPQDGTVTLKIYNVLGAEVMTLVNKTQTKGKYQVTFDASRLSSGVYIYKIQSGSFFSSKKMILLK